MCEAILRAFFLSFVIFLQLFLHGNEKPEFGYLCYSTSNLGDDVQALAALQFLPEDSIPINREFMSEFMYDSSVYTLINGWFMHTRKLSSHYKQFSHLLFPEKSWPPSSSIQPLLISIHFTPSFIPYALSKEGVAYLKKHGPVGTRDYYTLKKLQKKKIPCYFSGCLTLTLDNPYKDEREDVIYAVDITEECLSYLKARTNSTIIVETHHIDSRTDPKKRLELAEELLNKYRKAKCVVTRRLHVTMPCLAFETPVLLILPQSRKSRTRFDGLKKLVRHCTEEEFVKGTFDFNFDHPSENSKEYFPIRKQLIETVTNWVASANQ